VAPATAPAPIQPAAPAAEPPGKTAWLPMVLVGIVVLLLAAIAILIFALKK
jgi:hypothetical protein